MSNAGTTPDNGSPNTPPPQGVLIHRPPFPIVRLLYSVGYGFIAWLVIHILFFLAAAQFVVIMVTGSVNEELKRFSLALLQYEWELLAFIVFVRDEQPFPIGPFPKHA